MKNRSIMKMLEALAQSPEVAELEGPEAPEAEEEGASAAERLGRAMLDAFGSVDDGVTEDELVDAILGEWAYNKELEESGDSREEEVPSENESPFNRDRRPVPMRTASAATHPVDYADMSAKQFGELKKLLKRASADGRRIRL